MDPVPFRVFADEFHRELNRVRAEGHARRHALVEERAAIKRRLRKLIDAIVEGVSARTLKDELNRLEVRQRELDELLSNPVEARPLIHPNLAAIYRPTCRAPCNETMPAPAPRPQGRARRDSAPGLGQQEARLGKRRA